MDRVEMMSATPAETEAALGQEDKTVGVIRGNRENYNAANQGQRASGRKSVTQNSEDSDSESGSRVDEEPSSRRVLIAKRKKPKRILTAKTRNKEAGSPRVTIRPFWRRIPSQEGKPFNYVKERLEQIHRDTLLHAKTDSSTTSSSDTNSESGWVGKEAYSDERDKEWIEDPGEDNTRDDMTNAYDDNMKEANKKDKKPDLDPECTRTMRVLNTLFIPSKIFGRMPFHLYKEDDIVKFELRTYSLPFIFFCISSFFLMFNTAMMAQGLVKIFFRNNPVHLNPSLYQLRQVENRLFDKYVVVAAVTFLYCLHASVASLALIFDEGYALANYMKRFNHLVVAIKYGPYDGVRSRILLQHAWFVAYAIVVTVLFAVEMDEFTVVRGASDLIGVLVFVPIDDKVIFSKGFYFNRYYGFFLHLYAIFASHTLVMWPVTYSHVLENMARIWNLRMAHVFGLLARPEGDEKVITYHTVIPYSRLLAEHIAITDLLKETGNVFSIGLGIYYATKFSEMVLLGYRAMSLIIFPVPKFNETYVKDLPPHLPKFAYTDTKVVMILTALVMLAQSMFGWFIISHWITNCGHAIMCGFEFARRHAVILCEGAIQRRFIESICCTFAPIGDFYMRATFTINKKFIYDMFFWWVVIMGLLTAFSPVQLQTELITVCSPDGNCTRITISRVAINIQGGKGQIIRNIEKEKGMNSSRKATSIHSTTQYPPNATAVTTPTTKLVNDTLEYVYTCGIKLHDGPRLPTGCDKNGKQILDRYDNGGGQCPLPESNRVFNTGEVYACYDKTHKHTDAERDSCGNLNFKLDKGNRDPPKKLAVLVYNYRESGSSIAHLLCCYFYGHRRDQALSTCNMPNKSFLERKNPCRPAGAGRVSEVQEKTQVGKLTKMIEGKTSVDRVKHVEFSECYCDKKKSVDTCL